MLYLANLLEWLTQNRRRCGAQPGPQAEPDWPLQEPDWRQNSHPRSISP